MLQEVSNLADRGGTFKAHVTRPEGRHSLYARCFRLLPKINHAVPMLIDVEHRLRFARIEPDPFCRGDQDVDASDVRSLLETGREDLLVHRGLESLLGGVQTQFVRLPAPGYEYRMSHPDSGLPRQAFHGLSVGIPIRVRSVDKLLRYRAHFERVDGGFDSIREELAQLPVGQVRSWIDIIEVEHKSRRVVHSQKLLSALAPINLTGSTSAGRTRPYLIVVASDSIFPA